MNAAGRKNGLTWGMSPEITAPGLNYYRDRNKAAGTIGEARRGEA